MSKSPDDCVGGPYVVDFDYKNPSPRFTQPQIDRILSITKYLSEDEVKMAMSLEHFTLWLWTGDAIAKAIPGLRPDSDNILLYISKPSSVRYIKFKDQFLDRVLDPGMDSVRKFVAVGWRIILPDGRRFYPFEVGSHNKQWGQRMLSAAHALGHFVGEFDAGVFSVSDGRSFKFGDLKIDELVSGTDLDLW